MSTFIFVGEKRSDTAIRMGVTWQDRRLCSKTLNEALDACDLGAHIRIWKNLFCQTDRWLVDGEVVEYLRTAQQEAYHIVALGRRVQRSLHKLGIQHIPLIHPAARGSIRKSERYRQHVQDTLSNLESR